MNNAIEKMSAKLSTPNQPSDMLHTYMDDNEWMYVSELSNDVVVIPKVIHTWTCAKTISSNNRNGTGFRSPIVHQPRYTFGILHKEKTFIMYLRLRHLDLTMQIGTIGKSNTTTSTEKKKMQVIGSILILFHSLITNLVINGRRRRQRR